MTSMTFGEFETQALARGFDAAAVRHWEPGTVVETHSHPFDASALMVDGEMWLTVGDDTRHLRVGDSFELAHRVAHAERYGAEGATFWVARRTVNEPG